MYIPFKTATHTWGCSLVSRASGIVLRAAVFITLILLNVPYQVVGDTGIVTAAVIRNYVDGDACCFSGNTFK